MKSNVPSQRVLALVAALLFIASPCEAQGAGRAGRSEQAVGAPDREQNFETLHSKALTRGSVRVIIQLDFDFAPVGTLPSPGAVERQREAITRAQDALLSKLARFRVASVKRFETIPFIALEVDAEVLRFLRSLREVANVGEDRLASPTLTESVSLVGATRVWAAGFSGVGQVVAVLDSGVDKAHPFLSGKVLSEACYSTNSPSNAASTVCPGGATQSTAAGSGAHCAAGVYGCDHGTHVAGIAVGHGTGFFGVAKDANLIAIQVFSRIDNSEACRGLVPCAKSFTSDQLKGLERVLALAGSYNIAAVNMSLGSERFYTFCDAADTGNIALKAAIDNLRSVRIATVISSGNDGFTDSMGSPGCISTAVSVGASEDGSQGSTVDNVWASSNSANFLSLLAPGRSINSSVPGGGFQTKQGTSMAAPHVAGAWAVYKSKFPSASVGGVLAALQSAGTSVIDARNGIVKPRLQLDAALVSTYTLAVAPSSQTVAAGNSASIDVTLATQGGFSGDARLSVSGLPAGVVARFSPPLVSLPGASTLSLTVSDLTAPGTYNFVVAGVSGDMRRTALGALTILPSPKDFSLSAAPPSQSAVINGSADYTVTLTPIAGYDRTVSFRAVGLPPASSVTFTPASLTSSGSTRMSVAATGRTPAGNYSVTVVGTDGHKQHSATVTLVVPKYTTLAVERDMRRILSGESTQYALTLTQNFSGNTAFSVSGLPSGVTPTFSPPALGASGTTTLTLATSGPGIEGTFPLNVSAAGSGATSSIPVSLAVLDTLRFGADGLVNTPLFGKTDSTSDAALQPDGKILVAGHVDSGTGTDANFDFALARYNADGSLDTSFGGGGKVITDFGGDERAPSLALQSDGKIVVAGQTYRNQTTFHDFALARYNADGSLDASFGGGGKVITDFARNSDQAQSVALQADGRIVVAGDVLINGTFHAAMTRYNSNGSLDTSFGASGLVTRPFPIEYDNHLFAVAVQNDQKIVVAGRGFNISTGSQDFLLARFRADGTLDTSFDGTGHTFTDISGPGGEDLANHLAIRSDGKIITAGVVTCPTGGCVGLTRHNSNGTRDGSFGASGKVTAGFGGSYASAEAVALQPDGKVVVAGTFGRPRTSNDFLIARFDENGRPDASFGAGGKVTTDYLGSDDTALALAVRPDGRIVVAGYSSTGASYAYLDQHGNTRRVYVSIFALQRLAGDGGVGVVPLR